MFYYALVHKDADSAYGVSFPDLPGCFSASDDVGSLEANAIEALALWFEDEAVVEPRSIEALSADADVAEALGAGAFLMAIPHIQDDTKVKRVNITMTQGMITALDETAAKRKTTRSGLIAMAVKQLIEA